MSARNVGTVYAGRPAARIRWPRETKITPLRIPWLERALTPCGVLESTLRTAPPVSAETMALQPILHDVAVYVLETEKELHALKAKRAPENHPEPIDLQARYRLLQADLEFWKGEAALLKEQAGELRDGLTDVREACNTAGETVGALDERVQRLAADRDRWKAAHDHVSFSFREQSRKQPFTPDATVEVPRPRTAREAAHDGEAKESVRQA